MALTSGAKKFSILVLVAAVIGIGGFFIAKKKPMLQNSSAPEQVTTSTNTTSSTNTAPQVAPATPIVPEVKAIEAPPVKKHVVVATRKKVSQKKSSEFHGTTSTETADEKALKALAGDKL